MTTKLRTQSSSCIFQSLYWVSFGKTLHKGQKTKRPPSKAGKGRMLIIAKFNDNKARNSRNAFLPNLTACPAKLQYR